VSVLCTAGTIALAWFNLTAEAAPRPPIVEDPLRDALDLRAEGDRLTEAGEFGGAIGRYEACLRSLGELRESHRGEDYAWLESEMTWTNLRIRTARQYKAFGPPPPPPGGPPVRRKGAAPR